MRLLLLTVFIFAFSGAAMGHSAKLYCSYEPVIGTKTREIKRSFLKVCFQSVSLFKYILETQHTIDAHAGLVTI